MKWRRGAREFPHLPAGREPGAQSLRSRAGRNLWSPVAGAVGVAMFAAGVWTAAGGRGAAFDRQEELFGGLFFAAGGLLCVYGALVIWERGRAKEHPGLRGVTLDVADASRRGDSIAVTVGGRLPAGGRLDVGIACDERCDVQVRTSVKGSMHVSRQTAEAAVHEEWQTVPAGGAGGTFTFIVPPDAPYSYEGDCVSYAWRVSARVDRPHRRDPRLDRPIWVDP